MRRVLWAGLLGLVMTLGVAEMAAGGCATFTCMVSGEGGMVRMSESQVGLLFAFSVVVIFLVLAALYESWTVPISIVLALPLGVIGGVLASSLRGLPNDVYFQIGLLTVLA